jgi:hypothetical protein
MLCLVTAHEGTAPALAVNEMIKAGLWLELEICIGFVVGVGLGSLMGQRTVPIVVLIVLDIIITPILADHAIPYFINGQRLVVGVAMEQLRLAALGPGLGCGPLVRGGALQISPMPTWAMTTMVIGWIFGWTLIGAWKMTTRDA